MLDKSSPKQAPINLISLRPQSVSLSGFYCGYGWLCVRTVTLRKWSPFAQSALASSKETLPKYPVRKSPVGVLQAFSGKRMVPATVEEFQLLLVASLLLWTREIHRVKPMQG